MIESVAGIEEPADPAPCLGVPPLLLQLFDTLERRGIGWCQWKGSRADRGRTGSGDLDLLVDRGSLPYLAAHLDSVGFRLAVPPPGYRVPGLLHALGLDEASGQLVHVHLHEDVVIGPAWRTHYRLPVAPVVLATAGWRGLFRVPAPEWELTLCLLRLALRGSARDAFAPDPPWLAARRQELALLEAEVRPDLLAVEVAEHLPTVDAALLDACRDALQPGRSYVRRLLVRRRVAARLAPWAERPARADRLAGLAERAGARLAGRPAGTLRLAGGGAVVALVGGDGAGKSTCARALRTWLAPVLATRHVHLGLPPRSPRTLVAGLALKVGRRLAPRGVAAHLELLRLLCTARDRYRLVRRARDAARGGALVLCERYPIPENHALAGPSRAQGVAVEAQGRLAEWMRRREERYYGRMERPDIVCVLRLHPDEAVRRKPSEPAPYVRARAHIVWTTEWAAGRAHLIDASRSLPEVLGALKAAVWASL